MIGCGNIGGRFDEGRPADALPLSHAGAFRAQGGFRIAACVDPDAERRAAFARHWDVAEQAATVADLGAEAGRFDLVSICSPTACHEADLAAALALRPRLVFAEKPLTQAAGVSADWVRRYEAADIELAVNHTRRWAPDIVALAADLAAGRHGAVRAASGFYTKGIGNNGSHMLDLLAMLLGPLALVAAGAPRFDFWEDDPSVPALLTAGDDIPVALNVGDASDYALFELRIVTEKGTIEMIDGGLGWILRPAGKSAAFAGYCTLQPGTASEGRYFEAMRAAASNLYDWLEHGAPLASNGRTALTAQKLCDSIRESALNRTRAGGTAQTRT
ncbi:Gfo/Idh/MocA family oxidoreductase [Sphingopyxis sp.]|uniref:Gfo/Idh/MocA family oxidoreductase n=1 Tax=Sphingopyxis sp. TaxID=1908224 RepID=UPI003F71DB0F